MIYRGRELLLPLPTISRTLRPQLKSKARVYTAIRIGPGSCGFALRVARECTIAGVAPLSALKAVRKIVGCCRRGGKSYNHECRSPNELSHFHFPLILIRKQNTKSTAHRSSRCWDPAARGRIAALPEVGLFLRDDMGHFKRRGWLGEKRVSYELQKNAGCSIHNASCSNFNVPGVFV